MCITIQNEKSALKYDPSRSLAEQLQNAREVVIDYDPRDPDMDLFLEEMEKLARTGVSCSVNVDLAHKNNIKGARVKRQIKRIKKDLDINEVIKFLVNIHSEFDKRLESISLSCRKR